MKFIPILKLTLLSGSLYAQKIENSQSNPERIIKEFDVSNPLEIPFENFGTGSRIEKTFFPSATELGFSLNEINFSSVNQFSFIENQPQFKNYTDAFNSKYPKSLMIKKQEFFSFVLVHINRCD